MQEKNKGRISNTLVIIVVTLIAVSVICSFYKYFNKRDYTVYFKETCDPSFEECLSEECDIEDPRCKPLEDGLMYYKEVYQGASVQ